MDEIDQRARAGAAEGLAISADQQSAGRGRAGRAWRSTPGDAILCSLLLRPRVAPFELGPFPLVIGLAISEAIEQETGLMLRLKWPNDLLGGQGKIGGVLLTSRLRGERIDWATVGFGINVTTERSALPPGGSSILMELGYSHDRNRLLQRILEAIDRHYRQFTSFPQAWDRSGWMARCYALGETVLVESDDDVLEGELMGIDITGALLLRRADGSVASIVAGDLVRGPRAR